MANDINNRDRKPGPIQIGIILITVCTSVLVTAILGPNLPKMEKYFAGVENVAGLVAFNMTAPFLVMAFFCVIAGMISDKFGRKWLLVFGALAYGIIGMIPMLLDNLHVIIASRIGLGFAEAFVVVIGAAYISDLFEDKQRERMFAMQATTASVSAFFFNSIGGSLGDISWRAPYALYSIGIVIAVMTVIFLWEPERKFSANSAKPSGKISNTENGFKYNRVVIAANSIVTIFASLVFIVIPLNFSYLFDAIGIDQGALVGIAYGVNSLGVIAGSILFGWFLNSRTNIGGQLAMGFGLMAIGFLLMWIAKSYGLLTVAGFIGGTGAGVLLPALIVWSLNLWPAEQRGRGLGLYMACQYFGNFLAGPAMVPIAEKAGGRPEAMMVFGVTLIFAAGIAAMYTRKPHVATV